MSLDQYRQKRDFERTPEPAPRPGVPPVGSPRFVVQRHHARRLHYDFRLEARGVLVSWAVPRGPSMRPLQKRMAVHVEDHPVDYFDFEGNIPAGNYGAGSVMVWDVGTYSILGDGDFDRQSQKGDLKLRLEGHKLQGEFALVRTGSADGKAWLLIKKRDGLADPAWDIEDHAQSVLTGRNQTEIAKDTSAVWVREEQPSRTFPEGAKERPMPTLVQPMLAQTGKPFSHPDWLFELKWDGWRALAYLVGGQVRVLSRRGNSLLETFPELQALRSMVAAQSCILDGEIVSLNEHGVADFHALQKRFRAGDPRRALGLSRSSPIVYYVFDLLYLDGHDLQKVPLEQRKALLREILHGEPLVRLSDHVAAEGEHLYRLVTERGVEGVVAKHRLGAYESRRSPSWLKIKSMQTLDCVVAGYTLPQASGRSHLKSLVLALHDAEGLVHVGNAGSGFTEALLEETARDLASLHVSECPLVRVPVLDDPVQWVRPERVCTVKFQEWSHDGIIRFPVFLHMRPDKAPAECRRDGAQPDPASGPLPDDLLKGPAPQQTLEVDGITLKFTNLDKLYYPADGVAKRDVINFYYRVSPFLVPHLAGRPLNLKRYPDGIAGEFFFQKRGESFPEWLPRLSIEDERGKIVEGVVCSDRATLVYLANLGCIDQNPLQSHVGSLDQPDWMLLDLDPQECSYDRIVEAALLLRSLLDRLELVGHPKTTGGRGMHVYVPVAPGYSFAQTTMLSQIVARVAEKQRPDLITLARSVDKRLKNRVYIDYPQGGRGRSISAPYVLRPHPGAPVATPLTWDELKPGLHPQRFNIRTVLPRLEARGDLFAPVLEGKQRLEPAIEKLEALLA